MVDMTPMVHEERRALAAFLAPLSEAQWEHGTWCDGWDVKHVVGHLVSMAESSASRSLIGLASSGFRVERAIDTAARKYAAGSGEDVFARYLAVVRARKAISGPEHIALGEIMVHGEDIRRGLGKEAAHRPESHLRAIIDHYRKVGAPLGARRRVAGLRLVATDIDWSVGEGPEVRGPVMSLILTMVGRRRALVDLGGPGKKILADR